MNYYNLIYQEIKKKFNFEDIKLFYVTDKSFFLKTSKNDYFIKESIKKNDDLYLYLKSINVNSINYPIDYIVVDNIRYNIFEYLEDIYHPDDKKIIELKNALIDLHFKTQTKKTLTSKNFKYLKRIYEKLDFRFKNLELFQRTIEVKKEKNDYDWIILSKYNIYLDAKKELYNLNKKINKTITNKISIYYAINHTNPNINHLLNNKLVSIDKAKFGIVVSDIAKFYIENDYINIDWFNLIDEWLNKYNDNFYKVYFKFLVLYIYILNLNILTLIDDYKINNYIRISEKIKKFLNLFYSYN